MSECTGSSTKALSMVMELWEALGCEVTDEGVIYKDTLWKVSPSVSDIADLYDRMVASGAIQMMYHSDAPSQGDFINEVARFPNVGMYKISSDRRTLAACMYVADIKPVGKSWVSMEAALAADPSLLTVWELIRGIRMSLILGAIMYAPMTVYCIVPMSHRAMSFILRRVGFLPTGAILKHTCWRGGDVEDGLIYSMVISGQV